MKNQEIEKLLIHRFLNYVRYDTESNRHAEQTPTTPGQWDLAKALQNELLGLGLNEVNLTKHCYVIAYLLTLIPLRMFRGKT
jgi:tripeptide aminopeptidase